MEWKIASFFFLLIVQLEKSRNEKREGEKNKRRVASATRSNFGIATVFAARSKVFIAFSRLHMPTTLPTVMNTNSKDYFLL
jgi:hypothetical protein